MAIFELGEFLELHCKDFKYPLNAVVLASAIYEDEPDANVYYIYILNNPDTMYQVLRLSDNYTYLGMTYGTEDLSDKLLSILQLNNSIDIYPMINVIDIIEDMVKLKNK